MIKRILHTKTSKIPIAAFILVLSSFGSAVLGLLRDRLLAGSFGASDELDIYYTSFRIPDFINMVLIMGAISAAIIPIFTFYWAKDKEDAKEFIINFLHLLLFVFVIISFFLFIFAPQLISLIAPGFEAEKKELTVLLTRIMFLSPILLGTSNIISGVLQVFSRFLVTALAPIMYNLGIIFGLLFFVPRIGLMGLAWGVVLGGFLHLCIQLPVFLSLGFKPQKISRIFHPGIKKVLKLMLPRSLGIAASQINLIVMTAIGSTLAIGSIAVFSLANNLSRSFLILLAVPFSTAVFPALSTVFSQGKKKQFLRNFSLSFRLVLFLIIPASGLLFILRAQVVRIIYGTGRFTWTDTSLTSACLALFSLSLFAYGLGLLLSKAFYAMHNTKTPTIISSISIGLNICLCFLFVHFLKSFNFFSHSLIAILKLEGLENISIIGLPLAYSVSGIVQFILLFYFLHKRIGTTTQKEILKTASRTILATIPTIIIAYLSLHFFDLFLETSTFLGILLQTAGTVIVALSTYFLFSLLLKSPEVHLLKNFLSRKLS
jgi:putative peptidoglycan lipid II flippase